MPKISPFLWFESQAEEAVNFYISIFRNSKINATMRYDTASANASGRPEGSVMTVDFELEGQQFTAINGGSEFKFTEAISFMVHCKDQQEVDYYWDKLSEGGDPTAQQCGWLKDKFGLSWQIVPEELPKLIQNPKAMKAMLEMKKIDLNELKRAAD